MQDLFRFKGKEQTKEEVAALRQKIREQAEAYKQRVIAAKKGARK